MRDLTKRTDDTNGTLLLSRRATYKDPPHCLDTEFDYRKRDNRMATIDIGRRRIVDTERSRAVPNDSESARSSRKIYCT